MDRWPHLKGIKVQQIDAEIGLLIGSDVPQALQPMEFKASKKVDHARLGDYGPQWAEQASNLPLQILA